MNRSNIGNVITNGMQILSVGAITAARTLGKADQTLNNLTKQERQDYYKMKADKIRDDVSRYNAGGTSPYQHLSNEEAAQYQSAVADDMRKKISGNDIDDVDDLMSDIPYVDNSPQMSSIKQKLTSDSEYLRKRKLVNGPGGRFTKIEGGED